MSILIKGMEMPSNCIECPFCDGEYGTCGCMKDFRVGGADDKPDWCPLEEVPETHDKRTETHACDPIDRQAAIDAIEESRMHNPHKDAKAACCHEYEHRHFINLLQGLPSAQRECQEGCIDWRVPFLMFILNTDEETLRMAVKIIQRGRNEDEYLERR